MNDSIPELTAFVEEWKIDSNGVKPLFLSLCEALASMPQARLEYKGRPGVSHSLRGLVPGERPLFVLVDVIDDEPENRWLSVCFYADLVVDPDERGDVVPGGLMGEDARCFDVENPDGLEEYMLARLREAYAASGGRL